MSAHETPSEARRRRELVALTRRLREIARTAREVAPERARDRAPIREAPR